MFELGRSRGTTITIAKRDAKFEHVDDHTESICEPIEVICVELGRSRPDRLCSADNFNEHASAEVPWDGVVGGEYANLEYPKKVTVIYGEHVVSWFKTTSHETL